MKKTLLVVGSLCLLAFVSCDRTKTTADADAADSSSDSGCYLLADGKDTTTLTLTINGAEVSGAMTWQPYEKDGAVGTFKGTKSGDLCNVLYDYTIEGNQQSEEKQFKLQGDKLFVGEGELQDPKDNGHMVFKDAKKVTFGKAMSKVTCDK